MFRVPTGQKSIGPKITGRSAVMVLWTPLDLDPTPVPYSAWQVAKPTAHLAPTSRCLIDIAAKKIPLSSLHNACRRGRRPSQVKGKSSPECRPCLALGLCHRTNSLPHQRARPRPTNFRANHPSSSPPTARSNRGAAAASPEGLR
jgi:hypothetical protein